MSNYSGKGGMWNGLILGDTTEEQKQAARLTLAEVAEDAEDLRLMLQRLGL